MKIVLIFLGIIAEFPTIRDIPIHNNNNNASDSSLVAFTDFRNLEMNGKLLKNENFIYDVH